MHYSLRTEKVDLNWLRFFIRWHGRSGLMKHPRTMDAPEIEAFLTMLASERKASTSTHNQTLCALLLFYRGVLDLIADQRAPLNRQGSGRWSPPISGPLTV